jgi:hypothetical protein
MLSKCFRIVKGIFIGITDGRAQAIIASKKYYGVHYN